MNIIDLAQFKSESLEVVMLDGRTIKLPKPAYKTFLKILDLDSGKEKGAAMIEQMYATAYEVINTNIDGVAYEKEALEAYPVEVVSALMREYMAFITGVMERKNL